MKKTIFKLGLPHYVTIETEEWQEIPGGRQNCCTGCDGRDPRGRRGDEHRRHRRNLQDQNPEASVEYASG